MWAMGPPHCRCGRSSCCATLCLGFNPQPLIPPALNPNAHVQEIATNVGYGAAALPLWEEFLLRFFAYQTQLEQIVPKDEISGHLAQLAQLYEASSLVLSDIYALLAPLSPESLPGKH